MAIKLDTSKAYDKMEWAYLHAVMKKLGFTDRQILLVMSCVSSVSYKIVHGAYETDAIYPSRGICQVDLCSLTCLYSVLMVYPF